MGMTLFICESKAGSGTTAIAEMARLLTQAGEPFGYNEQPDAPTPCRLALDHADLDVPDLTSFQVFKHANTPPALNEYMGRYGRTQDELAASARKWYAHYWRLFETEYYANDLDRVVTWGSGVLGNRCALRAAQDMGFATSVLEDGWFPYPMGMVSAEYAARPFVATQGAAYYEFGDWPDEWTASFAAHELDAERMGQYRAAWFEAKTTKYSGVPNKSFMVSREPELPEAWLQSDGERIVWAGQVHGDAAMYFNCAAEGKQALEAAARSCGAWYKGHPLTHSAGDPKDIRQLPRSAGIHTILPQTDRVLTLTSNVGLEAAMFGVPVTVFGRPPYAAVPEDDRVRFIDWVLTTLQWHMYDPERFVRRLKGDLA